MRQCATSSFLLLALAAGGWGGRDSVRDDIKGIVEAEARHAGFSGTVLVARGERVVYQGAFGYANREFEAPNTLQTRFNIGSITKTFTALAIAQLMEQGKLDADDPVARFLPEWPAPEKGAITIRHLLTHTSGLYDYANADIVFETLFKRGTRDLIPFVYGPGLSFQPGQGVQYSSGGYILLGAIVEKVSGMTFGDYLRKRILKPAGMERTALLNAEDVVRDKAVGYRRVGRDTYQNRTLWHFPAGPAGGLYTTAGDLLAYVRSLLDGKLTSRRTLGRLLAPASGEDPDRGRAAYGWWIGQVGGRAVVHHTGGTPGFSCSLYLIPDLQYIAIVLSNTFRGTTGITDALNAALTGGDYELADEHTYDLRRAVDLVYAGQVGDARPMLDRIVRAERPSRRAMYFAALARIIQMEDLRGAIAYLDRYITLTPSRATTSLADAWYRKGQAYEKLNEPGTAMACYQKCLALDPQQQRAADGLARVKK